jgi:hypothetical protein
MILVFCSESCCIRVLKEGQALQKRYNIPIYWVQQRFSNQEMIYKMPPTCMFFFGQTDYKNKLMALRQSLLPLHKSQMGPVVVHVHNEPDWLGWVAKEAMPEFPMVFDAHDLNSIRTGQTPDEHEKRSMAAADGHIFPSIPYMEDAIKIHGLENKPCMTLYSMANEDSIIEERLPWLPGIVYEGGIVAPVQDNALGKYEYRDYREFARKMKEFKIPFIVYGMPKHFFDAYHELGTLCIDPYPYSSLMRELSRYDWGLVGCPIDHPQWQKAMPNKMFEYIAAGIPCLVWNAKESGKFVEKYGLGIVVDSTSEIPDVYYKCEEYRRNVVEKRHDFTMEKQLPQLLELYESACTKG